jgi:hypothetical protein
MDGRARAVVRGGRRIFTKADLAGFAVSLNASIGRGRCERILLAPLRPPGLSVASRMRSSRSMRPAPRRALAATVREPLGWLAVAAENMGGGGVGELGRGWRRQRSRLERLVEDKRRSVARCGHRMR